MSDKLPNCFICNSPLVFHQDEDGCPNGCHYVQCKTCEYFIDFYGDGFNYDNLPEVRESILQKMSKSAIKNEHTEDKPVKVYGY